MSAGLRRGDVAGVSSVSSEVIESGDDANVIAVDTVKPANADYLHIEFVADGQSGAAFVFDNTALQSFGAQDALPNGDFENDGQHWYFSNTQQVAITEDPALVPQGDKALEFKLQGGQTTWRRARI